MFRTLTVLFALISSTQSFAGDSLFLAEAQEVFGFALTAAENCGLAQLDHEDPRLPRPQVPADDALVTASGFIMAYTNTEFGAGGAAFELKNPNGGYSHSVIFSADHVEYKTPYGGIVAEHDRFRTVAGWQQRYRCGSAYVPYNVYRACVQSNWTDVVISQLCH